MPLSFGNSPLDDKAAFLDGSRNLEHGIGALNN